jgi:hypothetical protein
VRSSRWDKKTLIGANQTAANRERKPAKKAPEKMRKKPPKRNRRFYEKTKKSAVGSISNSAFVWALSASLSPRSPPANSVFIRTG